jgi:cellobiose phosphorylase
MPAFSPKFNDTMSRLKSQMHKFSLNSLSEKDDAPLRAELFNADQMEKHGRIIAKSHVLASERTNNKILLNRLDKNETFLSEVHYFLNETVKENHLITPAGEWLLDNYYLIEDQIRIGKKHFPKGYSKELPSLLNGNSKDLPRVYDIAEEIISHGDGRVDLENLNRFLQAYQSVTALKLGELWAIPIMLRLALIENLRRVAEHIAKGRIERNLAAVWANQLIEVLKNDPKSMILIIADMVRSEPPLTPAFVSEFARRLQSLSPSIISPLSWVEQLLGEKGTSIAQLVRLGNKDQAADQVSISNSIGSLRLLNSTNWRDFVEYQSIVEKILQKDPMKIYHKMDFGTRDNYRHIIEKLGKKSKLSEEQIAEKVLFFSRDAENRDGIEHRTSHVGYYLVDRGIYQLEDAVKSKLPISSYLKRKGNKIPFPLFFGSIFLLTILFTAALVHKGYTEGIKEYSLIALGIISSLAVSQLAVALVNWLSTLIIKPTSLPRLDYSKKIPDKSRTLVVVPCMITSKEGIKELVESLEIRFLANRRKNLYFSLLTDYKDSSEEHLPEDEMLLSYAKEKIDELNEKYKDIRKDIFYLFHRPRKWNPAEKLWMGYERKRGKLEDLNSYLRGGAKDCFSLIVGNTDVLKSTKYIITLDADTDLPLDTAYQLIGTIAHPLNKAKFDESKECVTDGYTILQPAVEISLPGTLSSRYAKLFGGNAGIDPYTRTVSDVYQDIFGEGSYIGKAIYDIDMFQKIVKDRFPENKILSHDLLEGCHVRSGLLSDVQLLEEYPCCYNIDVNRRHRWIRGDWQIWRWILPRVPGINGKLRKNPLSKLSRWKIFDNLRRSLVTPSYVLMLLYAWFFSPKPLFWTFSVIGIIFIPAIFKLIVDLFEKQKEILLKQHLISFANNSRAHISQILFTFINLPFEASFALDAIVRVFWRMTFSKTRLLEWTPSNIFGKNQRLNLAETFKKNLFSPLFVAAVIVAFYFTDYTVPIIAIPILFVWALSPIVNWWISLPLKSKQAELSESEKEFLRLITRRTWAYFDTFVNEHENWLPPDNYQEIPHGIIAHRTSPTNIGMALIANLSAYDFGYITSGELVNRVSNTIKTMEKLERFRGHFYNWYDTLTLMPLKPLYVSSVDSGNLSGLLLTLRQGLLTLPEELILNPNLFDGLEDTYKIAIEGMEKKDFFPINELKLAFEAIKRAPINSLKILWENLSEISQLVNKIDLIDIQEGETKSWLITLQKQTYNIVDQVKDLVPWLTVSEFTDISDLFPFKENIPSLNELSNLQNEFISILEGELNQEITDERKKKLNELSQLIIQSAQKANERIESIRTLANQAYSIAMIEYDFFYSASRHLLSIGYNVEKNKKDGSYYDLLASEARLASYIAIAYGHLPQESWFALGRLITATGGSPVLLSWSGSMFEYLMPLLIMPNYENTLLDQTYKSVVRRQINYGKQRGVPWGISESGYNASDVNLNYQYRAFGVPGIGLKRGLAEDLVIAPYASALGLMVEPEEACKNLQNLADQGVVGRYGFYEAVDYTPARLPRGKSNEIVKSFMVHHEGMTLLALTYLLLDSPMQRRFVSDPSFDAAQLLLQEKIPQTAFSNISSTVFSDTQTNTLVSETPIRIITNPNIIVPETQLLSNGRYHIMVTSAGGGYSRFKNLALTRWREDITTDNWGAFCYLRDMETKEFWSNTYQPTLKESKNYEAIFSEGNAEFKRSDFGYEANTQIVISPEDDIEIRRLHLTNRAKVAREIEITSYAEIVMNPPSADNAHPAFGNLFLQTEIIKEKQAILAKRRPRSSDEKTQWMLHTIAVRKAEILDVSFETDRAKFIGRGNTTANPVALTGTAELSNSEGSVLDPIASVRYRIRLEPDKTATIDIIYGIGETRAQALSLIERYQDRRLSNRVFELSWTHSQVILRQINATASDAQLYSKLANSIVYSNNLLRANQSIIARNRQGQSALWAYAISGDLPIVLVIIEDIKNIDLVLSMLKAHSYWSIKGLSVDLVIWNDDHAGYRQELQEQILRLVSANIESNKIDRPGGVFVRLTDQISDEDRILTQTVARVILTDSAGTLEAQVNKLRSKEFTVEKLKNIRVYSPPQTKVEEFHGEGLIFFNGYGGFTPDGREYIIVSTSNKITPMPWSNVIANPKFGTIATESGIAYTWYENAHEYRLSPWNNDPVSDVSGELFYIRDDETGYFWSPTPLPKRGHGKYVTRHGFGYTVFEHTETGIRTELWVYVAIDDSIKFSSIKIWNDSGRARKLSVYGFVELVLGDLPSKTSMHVVSEIDTSMGAIFARNSYNHDFPEKVSFFQVDNDKISFTCNRTEFIGRNGTLENPAAMKLAHLSGKSGAGLDPCAAIQVPFEFENGREYELVFKLGSGNNRNDAEALITRYSGFNKAHGAIEKVWQYWKEALGAVQTETPDKSLDVLANGWLFYQTLSCRIWGRSGYYQSGGAFGFRDQLQDVMALIHSKPEITREQLLINSSHQFIEGDVQHWWHPPLGRGVRTHFSDDYLWLPLAVSRYVLSTGDTGVLDESRNFLEGRPLRAEDDSYYELPVISSNSGTLYQHCQRAIQRGLNFGEHGLPLIGGGDWNDGMNLIGMEGKGESVWLAFFLYEVLSQFKKIAAIKNDTKFIELCEKEMTILQSNIEKNSWDGDWYRRAYFDDGTPLGSKINEECKIDSISQSWSVISGAGEKDRSLKAIDSLNKYLVKRDNGLIQLLDPPFDKSKLEPGYIKGYVPGVRENGGQYTHAAIWAVMAFAQIGDRKNAWELFNIINPVNHGHSVEGIETYKVEPYVVAADVYAAAPHTGRGGWTWYTGSAGWMYRLIIESLLGLHLEIDKLYINPCIPKDWNSYKIFYHYHETRYNITINQVDGDKGFVSINEYGKEINRNYIPLVNDKKEHNVNIKVGRG